MEDSINTSGRGQQDPTVPITVEGTAGSYCAYNSEETAGSYCAYNSEETAGFYCAIAQLSEWVSE